MAYINGFGVIEKKVLIYKVESRGKVATHRLQSAFIIVFQSRESGVTLGTAVRGVNLKDQSLISDPHGASKKTH